MDPNLLLEMQESNENSYCKCSVSTTPLNSSAYHEIGAEVIGNQLLIRIEKDKRKLQKKLSEWDPSCDCQSMPELKLSKRNPVPKIINIDDDNQIIFRIDPKLQLKCEDLNYQREIMRHELNDSSHNNQERTLIVYPELEGSGPQEIQRDHVTIGNKNIFMLKIKKQPDVKEQKSRNIELEVTYPTLPPRIPTPPVTPMHLSTPIPSSPLIEETKSGTSQSVDPKLKKSVKSKQSKRRKKKKKK